MKVEIDHNSGFCFGVTAAIHRAEELLATGQTLYCLGDIVHNGMEVARLAGQGLRTIDHTDLSLLHDATVLLRAHGEPPQTYATAQRNGITLVDATCPVVLALQRRIALQSQRHPQAQIVIFGKKGHAEVLGLVGQAKQQAIVVEGVCDLDKIDFSKDIYLYSQTTQPENEYEEIVAYCRAHIAATATFVSANTICHQVIRRINEIKIFAATHDVILFVCGQKSSNGRALYEQCATVNKRTHLIESAEEIDRAWFTGEETIGICGATSTPKWLMEECKRMVETL